MYGFALRGRWLVGHLVVLAIAALFVRLGIWQLDRLDEVRSRNRTVLARQQVPAVALGTLLSPGTTFPEQAEYRHVTVTGTYDAGAQATVQFRSLNGEPGRFLLTPLVTGGGVLVVNRGWVPASGPDVPIPPESSPAPGSVTLTGLLLPFEEGGKRTTGPRGAATVTRIDEAVLPHVIAQRTYPGYLQLERQTPPPGSLPVPVPPPDLGEGPHLSYAVQWFLFTAIGLVGWPILIVRSARDRARRPVGSVAGPDEPAR